jgi:putative inorganic carbon (HCO3(-)) transporter
MERIKTIPLLRGAEVTWKIEVVGLLLITMLSFFPPLFHLEEYLFFALFGLASVTLWWYRAWSFPRTPVDLPLLLLVGWVLLSVPFSIEPAYSFAEWRKLVAQVLVFYWTIVVLKESKDDTIMEKVLATVVISTATLSVYAIWEFIQRGGTLIDRHIRAAAPFSDFNWLSTYLVISIPFVVAVTIISCHRWQRISCGVVCCLALVTQFLSYSRAGWLALAVQGVSWGLWKGRQRLVLWMLGALMLVAVALLALSKAGYHRDTVDPWTLNARIEVWKVGLAQVIKHPIVGIGYGDDIFMRSLSGYAATDNSQRLVGLHSTFLMVAMGSGLPAIILLLWIFLRVIRVTLARAKNSPVYPRDALSIGVAFMTLGFLVRNLFDYMFAGSLAYFFWIMAAAGLGRHIVDPLLHSIQHESD